LANFEGVEKLYSEIRSEDRCPDALAIKPESRRAEKFLSLETKGEADVR
jgi:hypothetical protein